MARDPGELYEVEPDAPETDDIVLLYYLDGFIEPNAMAANPPGEWNSYDITLIGRRVTVVANGQRVICDQVIPGPTGGALDSNEGEPGPLYIQGDHTGGMKYRNIRISFPKS